VNVLLSHFQGAVSGRAFFCASAAAAAALLLDGGRFPVAAGGAFFLAAPGPAGPLGGPLDGRFFEGPLGGACAGAGGAAAPPEASLARPPDPVDVEALAGATGAAICGLGMPEGTRGGGGSGAGLGGAGKARHDAWSAMAF
jgi:hypothetical protein